MRPEDVLDLIGSAPQRFDTVRAGYLGRDRIRASITRADIATFLLDQSTDPRFHRSAPVIGN